MKASILRAHGIKAITLQNGTVIADEQGTLTNVTNMTISQLKLWLGY